MPMPDLRSTASQNRPVAAGSLAGAVSALLVSLSEWGLDALAMIATIPTDVQDSFLGVMVILSAIVGGLIGKVAQRHTWSEHMHKAAVAYALQLDPSQWQEALSYLGLTRQEALDYLGGLGDSEEE